MGNWGAKNVVGWDFLVQKFKINSHQECVGIEIDVLWVKVWSYIKWKVYLDIGETTIEGNTGSVILDMCKILKQKCWCKK